MSVTAPNGAALITLARARAGGVECVFCSIVDGGVRSWLRAPLTARTERRVIVRLEVAAGLV